MIDCCYDSGAKCKGLSLLIPFTCQQLLDLGHQQVEPPWTMSVGWDQVAQDGNVWHRMGMHDSGFLVLSRLVLDAFKHVSVWHRLYRGCWEDGKDEDANLETKCAPPADLLPRDSLSMFPEVPASRVSAFFTSSFSGSGFMSCFIVCLFPLGLLLVYSCTISCVCWHQNFCEPTALTPQLSCSQQLLKSQQQYQESSAGQPPSAFGEGLGLVFFGWLFFGKFAFANLQQ